jgi:excinuclease UvrABC nuclease subunit
LRSYFAGDRQRPAVEAALGALARVEWRELGSEVEAALEELRLIRELRPPANARGGRPQSYLRRRGERWVVVAEPTRFGPVASKRRAQLAARALDDFDGEDLAQALPPLRAKLRRLAGDLRFEDAARVRDRVAALEAVVERVDELDRLRAEELCLLAPARAPGFWRAFVVAGGRVRARTIPRGAAGRLEVQACLAAAHTAEPSLEPEDAADLLVVSGFLRKPPPELRIVPLRLTDIQAA